MANGPLAIVLAAGKSTRMKSALPKVLHEVCGRPMIDYVLDAALAAGVSRIVAVVGHRADLVRAELSRYPDVEFALQSEQKGTGHAVMMCREHLAAHQGSVLVLAGDTPLLKSESLAGLLRAQAESNAAAVIGTTETDANQGLGRIVREASGEFDRIVEERDATEQQRRIREINTGCYAFDSQSLLGALDRIRPDNNQAEYYLTDCPVVLKKDGQTVVAANVFDVAEAMGVNTRAVGGRHPDDSAIGDDATDGFRSVDRRTGTFVRRSSCHDRCGYGDPAIHVYPRTCHDRGRLPDRPTCGSTGSRQCPGWDHRAGVFPFVG